MEVGIEIENIVTMKVLGSSMSTSNYCKHHVSILIKEHKSKWKSEIMFREGNEDEVVHRSYTIVIGAIGIIQQKT